MAIAFPISIAGAVCFGFAYVRNGLIAYASASDLVLPLLFMLIWSAIAIPVLRRARRDSKLLSEGDWAVAIVTAQWMTGGGRNRRSKISFQFRDPSGRLIVSEAYDESRALFEEMEITVFHDPINPENCVPLALATCEIVQR